MELIVQLQKQEVEGMFFFFFFVCTGSLLWHSGLSLVLAQGLSCLAVCGILVP